MRASTSEAIPVRGLTTAKLPFHFTGTIDKLTYKLGPNQMTAEEQKAAANAVAKATD